jgi:CheY-like chemotaxis protein
MTRILVADSDPHIQLLCREELREEGYEVVVASNGREALNLLDTTRPDLVVLEIVLPDMSGIETLRMIKGTCSQTPVIFHSTYGMAEAGADYQCDGVVLKTHNLDSLKRVVQRFFPSPGSEKKTSRCRVGSKGCASLLGVCHGLNGN